MSENEKNASIKMRNILTIQMTFDGNVDSSQMKKVWKVRV